MTRLELPWPDSSLVLDLPFAGLGSVWQSLALGAIVVVPLVLILVLLRNELRLVSRGAACLLLLLRLLLLGVIIGLVCFQPKIVSQQSHEEAGRVVVLVDRSASMDLTDRQRTLLEKLQLSKTLALHDGFVSDSQLDEWIEEVKGGKTPTGQTFTSLLSRVDNLPRSEIERLLLAPRGLGLLSKLGSRHKVELAGFHRQTWNADPNDLVGLCTPGNTPEGEAQFTDMRQALARASQGTGSGSRDLLGVIVLTDGQHNLGDSPVGLVADWQDKVPIFPIAIGARTAPSDIAVLAIQGPSRSLKDDDVSVRLSFRVSGMPAQDLEISLHLDDVKGKVLQKRTVAHDGKKRSYEESFSLKLGEVGAQKIVGQVTPTQGEEARTENNQTSTDILVTDDKARVLLVDGEMRWESHYLASALLRDPKIRLKKVIFEQPRLGAALTVAQMDELGVPRTKLPEGADALSEFQCIILGDVTPDQLPQEDRKRLEKFVAERGGTLVMVAGKRSFPLGFPSKIGDELDPLAKLLPLESMRSLAIKEGFGVTRTAAGLEQRYLEMETDPRDNDERWASFPPSYWAIVGKPKPGATVLAIPSRSDKPGTSPADLEKEAGLIVLQHYGLGRVLFVGMDSTWRWRYKVGDTYHHRFWGQAIRWAVSEETLGTGNKYVRFGTQQPTYTRGQDVQIQLRLEEEAGNLKPGSPVAARIVRKGTQDNPEEVVATVPLGTKPAQPRAFDGVVRDLPEGDYEIELAIPDLDPKMLLPEGEQASKSAKGLLRSPFAIRPTTSREFLDLEVNEELLRSLASLTGGKVHTPVDAAELIEALQKNMVLHVEPPQDHPLYLGWWPLAVLLGLLTLEWLVRKSAGLP